MRQHDVVTVESSPRARPRHRALRSGALAVLRAAPYPTALAVASALLDARSEAGRAAWLRYASTDLTNLAAHPVPSLALSVLFSEEQPVAWVVLALAGLAALGTRLGAVRALALAVTVHVVATLVSQGLTAWRVHAGDLPASARVMLDVGPSYVVVTALVAAACYGVGWARLVGAAGFAVLVPSLFGGLAELEVTAVGHATSCLLGVLSGVLLPGVLPGWPPARWRAGSARSGRAAQEP